MPWPPEIQEAEDRMNQAKDAVLADVESGQPYNGTRRQALLAAYNHAQEEFFALIAQLHE